MLWRCDQAEDQFILHLIPIVTDGMLPNLDLHGCARALMCARARTRNICTFAQHFHAKHLFSTI